MDLHGRTVWQQAAGDTNRNYVNICLDWDVILKDQAVPVRCREPPKKLRADEWGPRKISDLRRF
jgi:hypothetical protein